jgi:hypothetical protein
MPIRRYVENGVFTSDALSAMSKAFEAAIWTLGPESAKRNAKRLPSSLSSRRGMTAALTWRLYIVGQSRNSAVRSWRCSSMSLDTAARHRRVRAQMIGARTTVRASGALLAGHVAPAAN